MPTIPVSIWEQVPVIVIFALLMAGLGWLIGKMFSEAVAKINLYYATLTKENNLMFAQALRDNNELWQKYFDARAESNQIVNEQVTKQLAGLTEVIQQLVTDFERHDQMERQALDQMGDRRSKLSKRSSQ